MTDKKFAKLQKVLGNEVLEDLKKLDKTALEHMIAASTESVSETKRELEANSNYVAAKQAIKDLSEGLKEVKKYQGAKISFALHQLRVLRGEEEAQ